MELVAAGSLLVGLIMYATFGGADFGGGVWTALAWGPRRDEQRRAIFEAMGPVWETNHVWLVFVVVILFTAFPPAFAALFESLLVPLVLALVGINFRGAAFAYRHFAMTDARRLPATGQVFSISSVLTPLFLAMAVTATAAGRLRVEGGLVVADEWVWVTPFTVVGGLVGLGICAYLTPIYMTVRTSGPLQDDFRLQALVAALALGILSAAEIPIAWATAPLFAERLLRPFPLIFVAAAVMAGLITMLFLWRRRFLLAQVMAAGTVAATLTGFGAALYPDLIIGQMSLAQAMAPPSTLLALVVALAVGMVLLVPSLILLYRTFSR